jgi:hypothetical protein
MRAIAACNADRRAERILGGRLESDLYEARVKDSDAILRTGHSVPSRAMENDEEPDKHYVVYAASLKN